MDFRLDIQSHLERVSRSFAFCIARLDQPLRKEVGIAYLLCRILDTVEDSQWLDGEKQRDSFNRFILLLSDSQGARAWSEALLEDATGMSSNEAKLVLESDLVLQALQDLSPEAQKVIASPVVSMAQGMREFAQTRSLNDGRLKLETLQDVNHYCFFVAGVVGEILDGLLRVEAQKIGVAVNTKLSDGFRFGLFLQKVNVLKDRDSDLIEGRDLVPIVEDVFDSSFKDAERAFAYIQAIPDSFVSYRLFCSWSMFLGLASLKHVAVGGKIGRLETLSLLTQVEIHINSPRALESLFEEQLEAARSVAPKRNHVGSDIDANSISTRVALYRTSYVGSAPDKDLLEIASS